MKRFGLQLSFSDYWQPPDAWQPTTVLVDPTSADGAGSGLAGKSLIKCHNLATVRQKRVLHIIGQLSDPLIQQLNDALKKALDLP